MNKPDDYDGERRREWLLVGNLGYLMALEAVGLHKQARRLVDKIAAGLRREPAAQRRSRHQRKAAERRRAIQLLAPVVEPEPDHAIVRDLRALQRAEAAAAQARRDADIAWNAAPRDNAGHREAMARLKAAQDRIRVLRRNIDAARQAQVDRRWAEYANGETETLAKLRREEVAEESTEVPEWLRDPDTGGLVKGDDGLPVLKIERASTRRVLTRSGLDLAFVRGDLGEGVQTPIRLREVGRSYALAYQAASAQLTPEAHEVRGSGIPEPQLATLSHWHTLTLMRGDRPGLRRMTPKQRATLDRVCGMGLTVTAAARDMRAGVPSVRRALRAGLEVADENLKAATKRTTRKAA